MKVPHPVCTASLKAVGAPRRRNSLKGSLYSPLIKCRTTCRLRSLSLTCRGVGERKMREVQKTPRHTDLVQPDYWHLLASESSSIIATKTLPTTQYYALAYSQSLSDILGHLTIPAIIPINKIFTNQIAQRKSVLAPRGIHGVWPCRTVFPLTICLLRQLANSVPLNMQTSVLPDTSDQGRSILGTRLESRTLRSEQGCNKFLNLAPLPLPGIQLSISACPTAFSYISVAATLSKSCYSHLQVYYLSTTNIQTVIATYQ